MHWQQKKMVYGKIYSTQEYIDTVNLLSYAFIQIGIKPGDKIGLISNNRPEWNFIDYACSQTGSINTPLYPTISDNDLKYVIADAGITYFFVSNKAVRICFPRVLSDGAASRRKPLSLDFAFSVEL